MIQRAHTGRRFDEPEVTPPGGTNWRSGHLPAAVSIGQSEARSALVAQWFGLAVLVPAIAVIVVAILLALLGIFIMWLSIVGLIMAAIVCSDVVRRSLRRWAKPLPGVLDTRTASYSSR